MKIINSQFKIDDMSVLNYYELEQEESITNLLIEYTKTNYNKIIK